VLSNTTGGSLTCVDHERETTMTEPPSRWTAITAFALVGAATQLLWLNFAGVTTVAATHYGVSEAAVGWLAQVFPLLYVVLAIPAGLILDRWFRGGLAAGALLTLAGAALRLVGDDFAWALIGQTVVAIAQPLVLNAITGITGRYLAEKDRPAGIAIGTASTFAGMVLAFVLSAVFPAGDRLSTVLALSTGFTAVAALAMVIVLRAPGNARSRPAGPSTPSTGRGALKLAWGDPFIRRLCALVFLPFGLFIALSTFAQALLEPAGVSGGTASVILLVNVVAGVLGCAVVPIVAAKRGIEPPTLVTALVVSTLGCVALALVPGVAVGYVVFFAIGFVLLPTLPIVLALTERRTGEAEGTAAGLIWMAGNLGGLVVATVVGLLVDRPSAAFLLTAACALVAVGLVRLIRTFVRDLPQPADQEPTTTPT
jgi:predicted MFS family arabinose efflux permease